MGGKICVGIRHTLNGAPEEIFLFCHTNPLSRLFMTRDFLEQGETLRKFIAEAKPENHWDRNQRINEPKLPKDSYGFVLIDFVNKRLFSQNDYTSYGSLIFNILYASPQDPDLACMIDLLDHHLLDETIEPIQKRQISIRLETFCKELPLAITVAKKRSADRESRVAQILRYVDDLGLQSNDRQTEKRKRKFSKIKSKRLQKLLRKERIYQQEDLSIEQPLFAPLLIASLSSQFFVREVHNEHPRTWKKVRAWAQAQGWQTPFGRSQQKTSS